MRILPIRKKALIVSILIAFFFGYNYAHADFEFQTTVRVPTLGIGFDFTFNDNGNKLFIVDTGVDGIREYDLSTPYDISTSSISYNSFFDLNSETDRPNGMIFTNNGSTVYVVESRNDSVLEYTLSTPYDISTATYDSVVLDVSPQDTTPLDILFNNDGTVLYIAGQSNEAIYSYDLSTPYDISTATYDTLIIDGTTNGWQNPYSLIFGNSGNEMYLVGPEINSPFDVFLWQYNPTSPYDLSSVSFQGSINDLEALGVDNGAALLFNNDESVLYILDSQNDDVYVFNNTAPPDPGNGNGNGGATSSTTLATPGIYAFNALSISMLTIGVYFMIFFFIFAAVFWGIALLFRVIFKILSYE